jgi:hypothetical protein
MEQPIYPYLLLSELEKTDFWRWFNIRITDEKKIEGGTKYYLKPGGHQTAIDLAILENSKKYITECALFVKRDWIPDESFGLNPLSLDIVGSFIQATVSPLDRGSGSSLRAMFNMRNVSTYNKILQNKVVEQTEYEKIMSIYFGMGEYYLLPLKHSSVSFRNESIGSVERLIIKTNILE